MFSFSNVNEIYDGSDDKWLYDYSSDFNTEFDHRFVPGDVVCNFDVSTGNLKIFECPEAPGGNWCCTPYYFDTSEKNEKKDAVGNPIPVSKCLTHEEENSLPKITIFEHVKLLEKYREDVDDIMIPNVDPSLQNWVDVTDQYIGKPYVSLNGSGISNEELNEVYPNVDDYFFKSSNDNVFRFCYEWDYVHLTE